MATVRPLRTTLQRILTTGRAIVSPRSVASPGPVPETEAEADKNRPVATVDPRLVESEQRYQAVIENASDMIQSVRPDGTFEFVNRSWRTTMGYTDDDLAKMTIWDIIHPDSLAHCQGEFVKVIGGQQLDIFSGTFVAKDGRAVPIEGSVTFRLLGDVVVATHGFFRDITERLRTKELEERTALLEREERARYLEKMAALGKLSAGLAHELNNPTAAVQRANSGLREALQRRDSAMRTLADSGCTASTWLAMDALVGRVSAVRRNEDEQDPVALSAAEATIESWLEDQDVPRAWELAPALAVAGINQDDLATIGKLAPAGALPAAVAWINETLVIGESSEIIAQSSQRITDLVRAIKGYSHMDRATEHDADIHDGLENTLIILAHRLQNVEIRRQYDRSLPPIRVFGNTLNQVWTNLIDNAIDAMNDTGRIAIRTMAAAERLVVEIEDNGAGIPADALTCIFEPFFTSKPQGKGTGLGLDTAWRIVTDEHGGTIAATSEPGRTVFRVELPINGVPSGDVAPPSSLG